MTMLNSLRFYITLAGSTLVFLWCQKRRRWWGASMAAVFAFGVLGMTVTNYSLPNSNVKNLLVFGGAMLVVVAIALACFEVRWEEALFCAVAGYSVQFIIPCAASWAFGSTACPRRSISCSSLPSPRRCCRWSTCALGAS